MKTMNCLVALAFLLSSSMVFSQAGVLKSRADALDARYAALPEKGQKEYIHKRATMDRVVYAFISTDKYGLSRTSYIRNWHAMQAGKEYTENDLFTLAGMPTEAKRGKSLADRKSGFFIGSLTATGLGVVAVGLGLCLMPTDERDYRLNFYFSDGDLTNRWAHSTSLGYDIAIGGVYAILIGGFSAGITAFLAPLTKANEADIAEEAILALNERLMAEIETAYPPAGPGLEVTVLLFQGALSNK